MASPADDTIVSTVSSQSSLRSGQSMSDLVTNQIGSTAEVPKTSAKSKKKPILFKKHAQKVAQLEDTLAAQAFMIEGLNTELDAKKTVSENLASNNDCLETENKELKLQIEASVAKVDCMEQVIQDKSKQIDQLERQEKQNQIEIQDKSEEIDILKKQLAEKQDQLEILESKQKFWKKSKKFKKSSTKLSDGVHESQLEISEQNEGSECDPNSKPLADSMAPSLLDSGTEAVALEASNEQQSLQLESSTRAEEISVSLKEAPAGAYGPVIYRSRKSKTKKFLVSLVRKTKKKGEKAKSFRKASRLLISKKHKKATPQPPGEAGWESTDGPSSQDQTQLEQQGVRLLTREMEESTKRSLAILQETENIGTGIAENLEIQHEKLNKIERTCNEVLDHHGTEPPPKHKPGRKPSSAKHQTRSPKHQRGPKPPALSSELLRPPLQTPGIHQLPSTGSDVVDGNLNEMSRMLDDLKSQAIDIGTALDDRNEQMSRIESKL